MNDEERVPIRDRRTATRLDENDARSARVPEWFRRRLAIAQLEDADAAERAGRTPPLPPHAEPSDETHDVFTCPRCEGLRDRTGVTIARRPLDTEGEEAHVTR